MSNGAREDCNALFHAHVRLLALLHSPSARHKDGVAGILHDFSHAESGATGLVHLIFLDARQDPREISDRLTILAHSSQMFTLHFALLAAVEQKKQHSGKSKQTVSELTPSSQCFRARVHSRLSLPDQLGGKSTHLLTPTNSVFHAEVDSGSMCKLEPLRSGPDARTHTHESNTKTNRR